MGCLAHIHFVRMELYFSGFCLYFLLLKWEWVGATIVVSRQRKLYRGCIVIFTYNLPGAACDLGQDLYYIYDFESPLPKL